MSHAFSRIIALCFVFCAAISTNAQTSPAPLPRTIADRKIESADGGEGQSLSEFSGKTILLIVVGQNSSDAGNAQQVQFGITEAANPGVVRITVADVKGVPFFVKGAVRSGIRKDHQKANNAIESSLKSRNKPVSSNCRFLTLLDWSGNIAKELGIGGKTNRTYHLFVINTSGAIVSHLVQGENGASEEATRLQAMSILQKVTPR